jgi:hypothetical protein
MNVYRRENVPKLRQTAQLEYDRRKPDARAPAEAVTGEGEQG